ncbi:MAG: cytochrome c [Cytophagaceae bacterium]|nr:cytochrome c [Gemmatimonadaceae bacterium]
MPVPRRIRLLAAVPALSLAVLACSGGGEKGSDTSGATPAATPATTASAGETIYQERCVTCHQVNGAGIPGTFPPLAQSEYANAADPGVPARIVIHGISGPITVHGATYNSVMPPYGLGVVMADEEIAQLLTYVRSSFGNSASAVTAADVAKAREATASHTGPMTVELLKPLMGGK